MRKSNKNISVPLAGRAWVLSRPDDLETLWDQMGEEDFGDDERLPYWTELWPSSLALGAWLQRRQEDIAGRLCLELGCGLGLTALAGQWLGARMIAMDYEPLALRYAALNATQNQVPGVGWLIMDWRAPALQPGAFSRIWGGDIMYEAKFASPIADFLLYSLAPGGIAWVAEPGRTVYQVLVDALFRRGLAARRAHVQRVDDRLVNPAPVEVTVWQIEKPKA